MAFYNLLVEVASHGYPVIVAGAPGAGGLGAMLRKLGGGGGAQSKVFDMKDSIDLAPARKAGKATKNGDIDNTKVATAG